ncbi:MULTISPECIES: GntR family transcriptional regulator [Paenarthrobacter]|uniref:GntR family transcriptional regulator n=1 Tax=Paenarthrobacter aromaticivorans TaxID=2849150 RepID=A0ABS6I9M6_9MICC|nr:GntR family transcriptional regulator [Paenarthrobacter sp. MMS21-TAE1-1]MBU8868415.1 GntR family transcriptional regulator [Paenarthrobacter sp. MMS21-TAE1-1]
MTSPIETLDAESLLADIRDAGPLPGEKRHEWLSRALREAIKMNVLPETAMLPTEAQLVKQFGLSRQTVRKALEELARERLIVRIAGKGTFLAPSGETGRQFSSARDLLSSVHDSRYELVIPLHKRIELAAAGRLRLPTDDVACASFRRLSDQGAFCYTSVFMPPHIGELLQDVSELKEPGFASYRTVAEILDERIPGGIASAEQSITASGLSPEAAMNLQREEGETSLRIDLAYYDDQHAMVELQSSYFLPESYSYRSHWQRLS